MGAVQMLCFALTLFLFNTIQCKKICDFTDDVCMTKGAKATFKTVLKGIEGKTESSDPLHYDKIEGDENAVKYKLTNITLTGLMNCDVTHLVGEIKKPTFEFFWRCPKWVLTSYYEIKGDMDSFKLNGKGAVKVTSGEYIVEIRGEYGVFIDENDHTPRIYIKDVDMKTEHIGKVVIEVDNLIDGDKTKSAEAEKYVNDHWKEIMGKWAKPILAILLNKVKTNHSEYMKLVHLDDLIPKL